MLNKIPNNNLTVHKELLTLQIEDYLEHLLF